MSRGEDTDPQRGHHVKTGADPAARSPEPGPRLPPHRSTGDSGRDFRPSRPSLCSSVADALGHSRTRRAAHRGRDLVAADSRSRPKMEQSRWLLERNGHSAQGLQFLGPTPSSASLVQFLFSKSRCLFPPTACALGPPCSAFLLSPGF